MPHYFFDLKDGKELYVDVDGHELDGDERAQRHAVRYLIESTSDALSAAPGTRKLAVLVRDTNGVCGGDKTIHWNASVLLSVAE